MYTILPYLSGKGKLKIYDNYNSFLTGGIEMIFITGDMHGLMERFQDSAFRHIKKGGYPDYLRRFRLSLGRHRGGEKGAEKAGEEKVRDPVCRRHP